MNNISFKAGFIGIVGAPNVGKSTFLNKILKKKISITSRKSQTTRNKITGILNRENSQMIFLDTPGIHYAKSNLNKRIVEIATSSIYDVDVILLIGDITKDNLKIEKFIISKVKNKKKIIFALNKIDVVKKIEIQETIDDWKKEIDASFIYPISAKHNTGIEELLEKIEECMQESPPLFPLNVVTDVSDTFIISEIIREKIFRFTGQEIPYSVAVAIDSITKKRGCIEIFSTIYIGRKSQKGIIIGKNGDKLKEIGKMARLDIEKMFQSKVFLNLFVKLQKNWHQNNRILDEFGLTK